MEQAFFTVLSDPGKRTADEAETVLGDALSAGAPWYN